MHTDTNGSSRVSRRQFARLGAGVLTGGLAGCTGTAARVAGINVPWYNRLMTTLTALVVVGAMQIMGVILVAAMLVVPVAAAAQIARGFREALLASVVLAQIAVLVGITLSYQYEATAGGTIVLVAVAVYIAMVLVGKVQSRRSVDEASAAERGATEDSPAD